MLSITRYKSVYLGISGYSWVLYEAKQLKPTNTTNDNCRIKMEVLFVFEDRVSQDVCPHFVG